MTTGETIPSMTAGTMNRVVVSRIMRGMMGSPRNALEAKVSMGSMAMLETPLARSMMPSVVGEG